MHDDVIKDRLESLKKIETMRADREKNKDKLLHEHKKEQLRLRMGITHEEMEHKLDIIKDFFNARKKEILKSI